MVVVVVVCGKTADVCVAPVKTEQAERRQSEEKYATHLEHDKQEASH